MLPVFCCQSKYKRFTSPQIGQTFLFNGNLYVAACIHIKVYSCCCICHIAKGSVYFIMHGPRLRTVLRMIS